MPIVSNVVSQSSYGRKLSHTSLSPLSLSTSLSPVKPFAQKPNELYIATPPLVLAISLCCNFARLSLNARVARQP